MIEQIPIVNYGKTAKQTTNILLNSGGKTMKKHWQSVNEIENLRKQPRWINHLLIGITILVILLLFCGCSQTKVVYVEPERVPITCIDHIKTPIDMAKCLSEYKIRY